MKVYFIVLVLSLIFLSTPKEKNTITSRRSVIEGNKMKVGYVLFSFMLVFVAGFRYFVGADFGAYYRGYELYATQLSIAIKTMNEPILPLIDRMGRLLVKDNIGGIFFPAAVTLFLILRTTYKYSNDLFFSSMLILFTCWTSCFNGVRQALAAAVLYCGFPFLRDRKFIKYAVVVFLAYLCHRSAFIMICAYFVCRNEINMKNVLLLVLGSLIILVNYDYLFSFIGSVMDKDYDYEGMAYITRSINPLRVIINCAPATYYLIKYWNRKKTKLQTLSLNFVVIRAVLMIAASGSAMLGRIGMYTSTLCVIAIPELNRGLDSKTRDFMKWVILILYGFVWLYEIFGSSSLNHFQFIWQK